MILAAERDLLPEGLFTQPIPEDGRAWWLVHTRPRQEKALARDLTTGGLSFYLPCAPHRQRTRGRVYTAFKPLFPGYAFVRISEDERNRAYASRRIARMVPVVDQARLWHDLRQVHRILDLGQPVTSEQMITPGSRVALRSGPLAGLTGTIIRAASGQKFVVQVDLIQKGVAVVVDHATLGILS